MLPNQIFAFFHLQWPQSDSLNFAKSTNIQHVLGVHLGHWEAGGHWTEILPLRDIFLQVGSTRKELQWVKCCPAKKPVVSTLRHPRGIWICRSEAWVGNKAEDEQRETVFTQAMVYNAGESPLKYIWMYFYMTKRQVFSERLASGTQHSQTCSRLSVPRGRLQVYSLCPHSGFRELELVRCCSFHRHIQLEKGWSPPRGL